MRSVAQVPNTFCAVRYDWVHTSTYLLIEAMLDTVEELTSTFPLEDLSLSSRVTPEGCSLRVRTNLERCSTPIEDGVLIELHCSLGF